MINSICYTTCRYFTVGEEGPNTPLRVEAPIIPDEVCDKLNM